MPNLRVTYVCYPSLYDFVVTVPIRCRLRAPVEKRLFGKGPPVLANFELLTVNTKFGTLMEFNERNSIIQAVP